MHQIRRWPYESLIEREAIEIGTMNIKRPFYEGALLLKNLGKHLGGKMTAVTQLGLHIKLKSFKVELCLDGGATREMEVPINEQGKEEFCKEIDSFVEQALGKLQESEKVKSPEQSQDQELPPEKQRILDNLTKTAKKELLDGAIAIKLESLK